MVAVPATFDDGWESPDRAPTRSPGAPHPADQARQLLALSREFSFRHDLQGRFTFVSAAIEPLLGHRPEELEGTYLDLLTEHSANDDVRRRTDATLASGLTHPPYPAQLRHRDGRPLWFEVTEFADERNGVIVGMVGIARRVDDEVRLRRELRQSRERFRGLFAAAPIGVAILDLQGRIADGNAALERALGRPIATLRGRTLCDFAHLDDREVGCDLERELIAGVRECLAVEQRFLTESGETLTTLTALSLVRDGRQAPDFAIAMLQDVSALRAVEAQARLGASRLERALDQTVRTLATALEQRDPYTAGHQARVAALAGDIARRMELSQAARRDVELAGALHDIGKIAIPAEILSFPGRLDPTRLALVQRHADVGYEILKPIADLGAVPEIVRQHHERLDGSGYPRGLRGDQVRLEARILAVADAAEAMLSHRPYRAALGRDVTIAALQHERGSRLDRGCVDACVEVLQAGTSG